MENLKRIPKILSPTKQKVLALLVTGVALGLTRSPRQYLKFAKALPKEWRAIDRRYLYRLLKEFRENRLVEYHEDNNGKVKVIITERGRLTTMRYDVDNIKIKRPNHWDGRWRIVFFDIPEKHRAARDSLREKLKELGFQEFQRSVFVQPYACWEEINFITEFFDVRPWVRLAEINKITNEPELLIKFKLQK